MAMKIWNGGSSVSVSYRIGRFHPASSFRASKSTVSRNQEEEEEEREEKEEELEEEKE